MNNLVPTTDSTGIGTLIGGIGGNLLLPGAGGAVGGQLGGILEGIIGGGAPDRMSENAAAMQKINQIQEALGFNLKEFAQANGGIRTYVGKWEYKKLIEDLAMIFDMGFYGSMGGGVSSYMNYLKQMLPKLEQYAKKPIKQMPISGGSSSQNSDPKPIVSMSISDYLPLIGIALSAFLIFRK